MQPLESLLPDGSRLLIRPITSEDRQRIVDGFARLSPESRYRRFFRSIDHLSDKELDYLTVLDQESHVGWIALLADEPGQPAIGVARWVRLADDPTQAEAAVTVIDDYQGRGLGKTLLLIAAKTAAEKGVRAFRVSVLGDNRAMIDLLLHLGAISEGWEEGVLNLYVPLPTDSDKLLEPAPLILKAVAEGRLEARSGLEGVGTTMTTKEGAPDRT